MEGPTKTRQGGLNRKPRAVTQKLFRTGGPQCPIAHFEKLLQKRPPGLQDSRPLYLTPLRKERDWTKAPVWFSRTPLGVHSIDTLMNTMAKAAGLDVTNKRYTNHFSGTLCSYRIVGSFRGVQFSQNGYHKSFCSLIFKD